MDITPRRLGSGEGVRVTRSARWWRFRQACDPAKAAAAYCCTNNALVRRPPSKPGRSASHGFRVHAALRVGAGRGRTTRGRNFVTNTTGTPHVAQGVRPDATDAEVEQAAKAIPRARLRYARGKVPFGVATRLEKALQATW